MISPQGYKLGEAPESKNPFWGEGEDSSVNRIYATATVDDGTGVPSVSTSKTVSGSDITFGFNFHNLKGERGPQGPAGATGATGPAGPAGADGAPGATGATGPQGPEGPKGDTGATGPKGDPGVAGADGVSPTARVEQTGDNQVTIYVTDANGTTSAVLNGEAGPQGPEGPQGTAGPKGDTGERGPQGPAGPVGPKGDTGAQGPEGPQGPIGETGPKGDQGTAGPGVPAGGTAGQVLTKVDGTDYNTEWKDQSGSDSSAGPWIRSVDGELHIYQVEKGSGTVYANSTTNMSEDFIELPKNKNGDYVLPIILGYESYSPFGPITVTSAYISPNFNNNTFNIQFTVANNSVNDISFSYDSELSFTLYTVIPKLSS